MLLVTSPWVLLCKDRKHCRPNLFLCFIALYEKFTPLSSSLSSMNFVAYGCVETFYFNMNSSHLAVLIIHNLWFSAIPCDLTRQAALQVVRKSSMHHEAAAMMGWPRISRASRFASRLSRASFSRGVLPGAFRARLPIKPGARSLQWKREGSAAQTTADGTKNTQNASLTSGNNVPSPTGRNLTYIRAEPKVDASSGPA